jgi:phage gpG-like protein
MITGALIGDKEFVRRLAAMPDAVHAEVERVVTRLGFELQARVQRDKLSGQVLKVRTGRLRNSIAQGGTDSRSHLESTSDAVYYYVGSNVEYAKFWEKGFQGSVAVKPYMRNLTMVYGRAIANPHKVAVRAFTRQINQPARPFLAPTLAEMRDKIVSELEGALTRAATQAVRP